jgi:hypothetical protein
MLRVDEASEVVRSKMFSPPAQRSLGGFCCISFPVFRRSQNPAEFGDCSQCRLHISFEIPKTNFAHKFRCLSFLDYPISKPKKRPMTEIPQKACPALLHGEGLTAHVSQHGGVSPKRAGMRKIIQGVPPQPEPLGLNDGNIQNTGQRAGHLSSLRRDLRFSAQEIASFEYAAPNPRSRSLMTGHHGPQ